MLRAARHGESDAGARLGPHACFDAALATYPTLVLPVGAIVDLLQVTHASERIAAYRDAMRRGDRFPPVSVVRIAGRFVLADGHKRFSAYRTLREPAIVVEVWPLRRLLLDQWRQFVHKSRQQWRVVSRSPVDPAARAQAVRLFWDTVGHWKRAGLSLLRRRRPDAR
jgi:hypothetical protein